MPFAGALATAMLENNPVTEVVKSIGTAVLIAVVALFADAAGGAGGAIEIFTVATGDVAPPGAEAVNWKVCAVKLLTADV